MQLTPSVTCAVDIFRAAWLTFLLFDTSLRSEKSFSSSWELFHFVPWIFHDYYVKKLFIEKFSTSKLFFKIFSLPFSSNWKTFIVVGGYLLANHFLMFPWIFSRLFFSFSPETFLAIKKSFLATILILQLWTNWARFKDWKVFCFASIDKTRLRYSTNTVER